MQKQKTLGNGGSDGLAASKKKTMKAPELGGLDELIDELTEEEELTKEQEEMVEKVLRKGYWTGCGCGGGTYFDSREEAIAFLKEKNWR